MGFFNLFHDLSKSSVEHHVSLDLTMPQCSRTTPIHISYSPTSTTRMPLELVMNIMELAYDEHKLEERKSFLKSCALVCRDWSIPAQKMLFRHVALCTETSCIAFTAAINPATARGRMLAGAVQCMRVSIDHNQPFGLSQRTFARAVTLCPNLTELNLALYGCGAPGNDIVGSPDVLRMRRHAPSFDEETLDLLRSGPRISALTFRNWSENRQSIMQLLSIWPTLESLVISGTAPELPSPPSDPFPCALSELRVNLQSSSSVDFFKWLLHNSSHSLRKLDFERELSPVAAQYLIDSHSSTLESVHLASCTREIAQSLSKCPNLRQLSVEDITSYPVVYKKLSDKLESMAFGLNKDTQTQALLDAIKAKGLLRAVTVHLWNGGELHRQLPSLKMTCALRGIDLSLTHDIRDFRSMIRAE
ncbi:hypothetical protein E1B28_001790 [Marasmius oreades]|uniref:F-box domain-containing protein n=1 Tax=Marasmius oreades TaxID=181124 RepID=A0A9P8AFT1_9AGAR|nr:uncharacterized protein E1B28_001790 [Marasmius oreades]KAG7100002.1 hypothetical protein E1B28_001790 [Marasmius oreades]